MDPICWAKLGGPTTLILTWKLRMFESSSTAAFIVLLTTNMFVTRIWISIWPANHDIILYLLCYYIAQTTIHASFLVKKRGFSLHSLSRSSQLSIDPGAIDRELPATSSRAAEDLRRVGFWWDVGCLTGIYWWYHWDLTYDLMGFNGI